MSEISESVRAEVEELAKGGRKIEAIKRLREATGAGLKESKEYVDALVRGDELPALYSKRNSKGEKAERDTHPQVHSSGCGSSMFALLLLGGAIAWFCLRVAG